MFVICLFFPQALQYLFRIIDVQVSSVFHTEASVKNSSFSPLSMFPLPWVPEVSRSRKLPVRPRAGAGWGRNHGRRRARPQPYVSITRHHKCSFSTIHVFFTFPQGRGYLDVFSLNYFFRVSHCSIG